MTTAGHLVLRRRRASIRVDVRLVVLTGALLAALVTVFVLSIALGEFAVPPLEVLATLAGAGDSASEFVVLDLRLPRAMVGLLAGASLAVAGAIFQQVTRNPLVAPDIVGVADGASFAAVAVIVFTAATGSAAVPLAALAGALLGGTALYVLAWRGGVQGHRLVLIGIGVAALGDAGVSYVLTEGRIFEAAAAYVWLVGSLNGRGWEQAWPLLATLTLLLPAIGALARRLDVLQLGDDVARSLGLGVERSRLALLAMAVVLTGVAVAAAGPIGFVAFLSPHIARRLMDRASSQALIPIAACCGAVLVLVADLAGRLVFAPTEIPVGIITSILAAPYFLFLLRRSRRLGAAG